MPPADHWIASRRPAMTGRHHAQRPAPSPERAEKIEKARFGCGETLGVLPAPRRRTRGEPEVRMKTEELIPFPRVETEATRHV